MNLFVRGFFKSLKQHIEHDFEIMPEKYENSITLHILTKKGVLEICASKRKFFSLTTNTFLIWIFIAAVILFGIASIFLKNQVKFVSKLSIAAERFGKGQEIGDFKPQGADEVRQAGLAFLQMKNRIQRQISERTMMLAGISHDLRTPLTRMKLQLAMMSGEDVEGLNLDIAEMEKMVDGYLAFIKGGGREGSEIIEFSPYIEEIVTKFKKNGCNIDLSIEDNVNVKIRQSDLSRAISNIINNADKYGKTISVIVRKEDETLNIIIMDDGPGIPYLSREDVFRAFYRIDESRNKETGGVGLGMTIARDTVLAHGGDIILDDSPLGGLKVTIIIPI
ncbi:MAG: Osmolarity sensor protein EnvZ [Alphaproteobacteria bacterium ADurb.Bin438]|nr:MAG: Osmolarity sensor protein EnvZ [Alphaproteobacteria bacterium ADurb.Bin438]